MLIQHFTPNVDASSGNKNLTQKYYGDIMVWACGSFAASVLLIIISTASVQIGRLRRQGCDNSSDDRVILTQNMEDDDFEK